MRFQITVKKQKHLSHHNLISKGVVSILLSKPNGNHSISGLPFSDPVAFPGIQRNYSICSHFLNAIADSAFKFPFLEAEIELVQSTIQEINQSMGGQFYETAFLEIGEVRPI
jgi:hypothetical protein